MTYDTILHIFTTLKNKKEFYRLDSRVRIPDAAIRLAKAMTIFQNNFHRWVLAAATAVGVLVGLGGYIFLYAEGFSYFSSDPVACANCHIMNSQYDSWQKGSHHGLATCVDCHLPVDFVGKYMAKASNGYHHSKGFTFQDFHEPILIKEGNSHILQGNCLRCHGYIVSEMLGSATTDADAVRCVKCHADVGHGETAGLGGPMTMEEFNGRKFGGAINEHKQ